MNVSFTPRHLPGTSFLRIIRTVPRKCLLLFVILFTLNSTVRAQNVLLNILTRDNGQVRSKSNVLIEVTVCNTSSVDSVPVYKLKPQISIPSLIAKFIGNGHMLPEGWAVVFQDASTIRLSNGTDIIPPHGCRTLLLSLQGTARGGPSTVSGNLLFSNGQSPGSATGSAPSGDNPADNNSTTTIRVQ